MAHDYSIATVIEPTAQELIDEVHPHLARARMLYLFTTQKRTDNGKLTLATAQRPSSLDRFLSSGNNSVETGHDFILIFGANEWEALDEKQQKALVDHELSHCGVRDKDAAIPEWYIVPHDVEEFGGVIQRHGLWLSDLSAFAEAIYGAHSNNGAQMRLPENVNGNGAETTTASSADAVVS